MQALEIQVLLPYSIFSLINEITIPIHPIQECHRHGKAHYHQNSRLDEGIGEQDDLQGAVDHLQNMDFTDIDLIGYSFGAAVALRWAAHHADHSYRIVLIAPPIAFMELPTNTAPTGLRLVITGSHDEIAPPDMLSPLLAQWRMSDRLVILQGADHSYFSSLDGLEEAITKTI